MRHQLLAAGGLCAILLGSSFTAAPPVKAAAAPALSVRGTIESISNNAPSETLTLKRSGHLPYTIVLLPTTTVTMLGGTAATYAALTVGDKVVATGVAATAAAPGILTAAVIRDLSVSTQRGVTGIVQSVLTSNQLVMLTARRSDDGFINKGHVVVVDVNASTTISLATGLTGTATLSSIIPGTVVSVAGVYDSAAHTVTTTNGITILSWKAHYRDCDTNAMCHCSWHCWRGRHYVVARLLSTPVSTTAPISLSVRIVNGPAISVTVSSTTTIVRRYNGSSDLTQLVAGDVLQIKGSWEPAPARTFDATRIRDMSEQEAFTGALLRVHSYTYDASGNTATGTGRVAADVRHAPYYRGEMIKLQFASTTAVFNRDKSAGTLSEISNISYIHAWGRYDRPHRTLYVMRVQV